VSSFGTRHEQGLTLVEVMISMAVLATAAMGVAMTMMTGVSANRTYQMNTMVLARAQHYVETLNNLQFGDDTDAALSAPTNPDDPLANTFNPESELGTNPPTLSTIARSIDNMQGDWLDLDTIPGFPEAGIPGDFLIRVSNNVQATLNYPVEVDIERSPGDGVHYDDGSASTSAELFGFEVFYRPDFPANAQPRLILRSMRARDP